jgi:predicted component of type VI protein secretion system
MNLVTKIHRAQLESTLIKLANADTQIEDLKTQLDDALDAEEMVVQLTERTLMLGEVTTVLRANIHHSYNVMCRKLKKCGLQLKTWKL